MEGTLKEIGAGPIRRRLMDLARWVKPLSLGRPNMKSPQSFGDVVGVLAWLEGQRPQG